MSTVLRSDISIRKFDMSTCTVEGWRRSYLFPPSQQTVALSPPQQHSHAERSTLASRTTPLFPGPVWPLSANATTLLLLTALALPAATPCSVSSANRAALPPRRDDALPSRVRKQPLLSRLPRPNRGRRSLLKLGAATAADGSSTGARPVVLEGSQLKALVQLKEAWGMWAGNSNATTACSAWTGVTCSPNGLVTGLDAKLFSDADPLPSGAIPASITTLATLQYLDLTYIDFVGPIPSLASLTGLTYLAIGVDGSRLTGTLDGLAWLSSLTNLQTLGLEYLAAFTGDLSSLHILSHLRNLQQLNIISLTNATGEIPREIRFLTALTALDLSYLRAVEFPDWVTHLSNLQYLNVDMDDPRRQGLLKDEMSELTALTTLSIKGNNLEGYLPKGWSTLVNLQELGPIPPHLAIPSLVDLQLSNNLFTGGIPNTFTRLTGMSSLALSGNNFTGSIPDSISTLTTLEVITLNNNQLTGTIPSAVFSMTNLRYLYMANNRLSGSLPDAISRLQKLEQIHSVCDVSGNSLYGRINRNFKNMVLDDGALINLAHNFFFGDAVLFAAGCQVCPVDITEPNVLDLGDLLGVHAGKCSGAVGSSMRDYGIVGAGKEARVSLSGNCLTLTPEADCPSNATQRSTAACQAFCSITDNGPCDGHGECVPPAPSSPSNFTCVCHEGYSTLDSGNGSTCAIVNSTTTTGEPFLNELSHLEMVLCGHTFHASLTNPPPSPLPLLHLHLPPNLPTLPTPTSLFARSPSSAVSSLSTGAIVGISVGCFAGFTLLAGVVAWLLWPRGRKKWEGLDVCEQFSLQQMVKTTNNWSDDNVLGKGGFGIVYKGHSPHGQLWAIKRSSVMTNDFEIE
ncbi:unnamed protein product [Closterium sp. Yama58-4]|nr:unnamed protein product [Closterium sp. Yama58-4]